MNRTWLLLLALMLAATLAGAGEGTRAPAPRVSPPGAPEPDTGPSVVVYPPQKITVRFDHKLHGQGQAVACTTCHAGALTSASVTDRLLPAPAVCDGCHSSDHANLADVKAGGGTCASCHVGWDSTRPAYVPRMQMPNANLVFDHRKHAARNIGCAQCHGAVDQIELATRDQLPRMRGCFHCHAASDAASRGDAASACDTCHLRDGGRMQTMFASGVLVPPRWMQGAEHTPDFVRRHAMVAGNDSAFCATCHKEDFCTDCHDGRVRPRGIHPSDYLNMHAVEARMATQRCTSCHEQQSFCVGCHQRLGITMTGPPAVRSTSRFHPPKETWSDAPRRPGHHAIEAQRNLMACVSCHIERDCVACHGGRGVGGGFNPHPPGFAAGCAPSMRRNPRPCLTCHLPDDAALASCQ